MKSIKLQYIALFVLAALLPLLAISTYFVASTRLQVRADIMERFETIANLKQEALHNALVSIADGNQALARNKFLIQTLEKNSDASEDAHDDLTQTDSYQHALHALRNYQESSWGKLHHVFVTDTHGRVVLSPPHGDSKASHMGQHVEHSAFQTAAQGQSVITDFFGFSEKDHFHQLHMEPVKDASGRTLGVIIVEIVIDYQMALLASNVQLGESGIIYLATLEGQKIVGNKEALEPPLNSPGIFQAIEKQHVTGEFTNQHGTPVLGLYLSQPQYPWVLCVEIDEAEVFAPVAKATYVVVLIVCVVAVLVMLAAIYFGNKFTKPILAVVRRAQSIATGDLTGQPLPITSRNELGQLSASVNMMAESLVLLVTEINSASREVNNTSGQIADSNHQIASSMDEQSSQINSISAAMEQLSCSVIEVAKKSEDAAGQSRESGRMAIEGGDVVGQTIQGMRGISQAVTTTSAAVTELGKRGEQIGQIVDVINDIADQTNLLALNAAIEAARAGEAGRGFAVVADEVRKLADRTTKATDEIAASIKEIQSETGEAVQRMDDGTKQVENGLERASAAGQSLEKIVASTEDMQGLVQSISATTDEQSKAAEMVSSHVISVSDLIGQTTEQTRHASSLASQLKAKSSQLQSLVDSFKTGPSS